MQQLQAHESRSIMVKLHKNLTNHHELHEMTINYQFLNGKSTISYHQWFSSFNFRAMRNQDPAERKASLRTVSWRNVGFLLHMHRNL